MFFLVSRDKIFNTADSAWAAGRHTASLCVYHVREARVGLEP